MTDIKKIFTLGAGNFGTCLSQHLARMGHEVTIWSRNQEITDSINKNHINPNYLSDYKLEQNLTATSDLSKLESSDIDMLLLAIPTQHLRGVLEQAKAHLKKPLLTVCAAKGIENNSLKLPVTVIAETLGQADWKNKIAILSGPSFAEEVIQTQPTAVSIASYENDSALQAQKIFHTDFFRAYTHSDPIGLEVAGALKNVIAIAAGICTGIGFQNNARAALVTRGLSEISRIGVALKADPLTFVGLGGVGDLFLTCTSEKSRNFRVGLGLAKGQSIEEITAGLGSTAEGITTTKAAYDLAIKHNTSAPITNGMYDVIYNKKPLKEAVAELMSRNAKSEFDFLN